MKTSRKKNKKNNFSEWFPRLSVIIFVFFLFAFLASDFMKLIENAPFMFNFIFGVIILAVLIMTWRQKKLAGFLFIVLGITYAFATWNSLLAVTSISTGIWLVTTGLLFLISKEDYGRHKKQATVVAHDRK